MATLHIEWKQTKPISIFEEAQNIGFDLRKFDRLHEDVQAAIKKETISRVLNIIKDAWDSSTEDSKKNNSFRDISNGVYVISIGHGFGIRYKNHCSEIMYIGRGKISNRIRSHLHNWIFEMSRSLRGVPFKFYMEEFTDGRSPDAFKDFEDCLLTEFHNKFGEKPLLNKISGRSSSIDHNFTGKWALPLKNHGKTFHWEVRPTVKNQWFRPLVDD
ncbi:hypothetical protein GL297_00475 [Komagataeibacter sp. FXV2]|nr:hypothetical protein [Komagataeibacter sp. FXV2]